MKESELILNADGSIYHLGLLPEQLAPTVLTVGDPGRVERVSARFDAVEHRVARREFVTHTGRIGHRQVSVVSTGIGPDNVDIVLNELDALVNLDLVTRQEKTSHTSLKIVRLGTTGGLRSEVPVDSLVVSHGALGLDGLLQFYEAPELQENEYLDRLREHAEGFGWHFPVAPYFVLADRHLSADLAEIKGHVGITATNPGFYAPQGRQLRAPLRFPDYLAMLRSFMFGDLNMRIVNLEMETAAIFGLSHVLGHRAASVSAVLANRADGTFSNNPERTVEHLIDHVLDRISAGI